MMNSSPSNNRREALRVGQSTTVKLNLLTVNSLVLAGLACHTDPVIRTMVRKEVERRESVQPMPSLVDSALATARRERMELL